MLIYTSSNFFPLCYNESITLVLFRIVHTVAFVTEVLYELDTLNVKIDYNMIKCAEAYYTYIYTRNTYMFLMWLRHSGSQNLRNNSPFLHTIDNHIENEIK